MATSWAELDAEWRAAVRELDDQGWEAEVLSAGAPVQVVGVLPSGERFYFRARWDEVSLAVGGDEPCDVPDSEWVGHESYADAGPCGASALPSDDGLRLLQLLYERYLAW